MINGVATWIFNLMLWGAIVTLGVLLYDTWQPGLLAGHVNSMNALIATGAVAVMSLLWPRY
jgi:hypothetical protein